jgi:hypothetical protein
MRRVLMLLLGAAALASLLSRPFPPWQGITGMVIGTAVTSIGMAAAATGTAIVGTAIGARAGAGAAGVGAGAIAAAGRQAMAGFRAAIGGSLI